ncbi:MAG: hypothetical protein AAF750_16215 [Planctomycetota bacterium]
MVAKTIQLELQSEEIDRLRQLAKARGQTEQEAARAMILKSLDEASDGDAATREDSDQGSEAGQGSILDRLKALGVVGCVDDDTLPTDLSSNPKHMEGFGE